MGQNIPKEAELLKSQYKLKMNTTNIFRGNKQMKNLNGDQSILLIYIEHLLLCHMPGRQWLNIMLEVHLREETFVLTK